MKTLAFFLLMLLTCAFGVSGQTLNEVYQSALEAYKAHDFPAFLQKMQQVNEIRPDHPTLMYNLAVAYAVNGQKAAAVERLAKAVRLNPDNGFETDADFGSLQGFPAFEALKKQAGELREEVRNSTLAFTLPDKQLHPEGIAYDWVSGDFFVGSIRQQKIVRVKPNGTVTDFATETDGLWAIMGMAVDPVRQLLWVCSTAVPEMLHFTDSLANQAAVLCFDLSTGKIKGRYLGSADQLWLGDLVISPLGEILVSSSSAAHPALYRVNESKGTLEEFFHFEKLVSLQGLCFDTSGETLFVADYRFGLFRFSMKNRTYAALENLTDQPLKGIDGLYFHRGQLVGIHNGLRPFQVVAYRLSGSYEQIEAFEYLDKALPEMGEPTLGVVVADALYYIANSPWAAYDQQKHLIEDQVKPPVIFKLPLKN